MPATIVSRPETTFTIQIEIPYRPSMLEAEETLQDHLNQAGVLATAEALQRLDTDGSPIIVGDTKPTTMGRALKGYQTPTGWPPSHATSTRAPGAARPTARSTATPALSAVPPP